MRSAAVTLLLLALALPVTAGAATAPIRGAAVADGPVIAGDFVVWGEGGHDRPLAVKAAASGGAPTALLTFPAPGAEERHSIESIAASRSHVAFIRRTSRRNPSDGLFYIDAIELWAGSGRSFTRVDDGCGGWPGSVDVDGSVLAYQVNNCGARAIVIRDLASGGPEQVLDVRTGDRAEIDLEGRYVAWWTASGHSSENRVDHVVVYDRLERREAYRADVTALLPADRPFGYEYHYDLQPDGKLAVAYGRSGLFEAPRLAWFSPAEPIAHAVPVELASPWVTLAGDRAAVCRKNERDYAVIGLDGTLVNRFDSREPRWGCSKIAFDGVALAWVAPHRGRLYFSAFPAEPPPEEYPPPVVTAVPRVPRIAHPVGRAQLGVPWLMTSCPERGGTCVVRAVLRNGRTVVGRRSYRLRARGSQPVTLRLTRAGRSLLRRVPRARAEISVRVRNAGGTVSERRRLALRRKGPVAAAQRR